MADHGRRHGRRVGPHEDALEAAGRAGDVEGFVVGHAAIITERPAASGSPGAWI